VRGNAHIIKTRGEELEKFASLEVLKEFRDVVLAQGGR
jgi:hypothetical protein